MHYEIRKEEIVLNEDSYTPAEALNILNADHGEVSSDLKFHLAIAYCDWEGKYGTKNKSNRNQKNGGNNAL